MLFCYSVQIHESNSNCESEGTLNLVHSSIPLSFCHKNFNLIHNFWTLRGRAFIFDIHIPCSSFLLFRPFLFYFLTLTVTFDKLLNISENFNICYNLWTIEDRAFIFHMFIPSRLVMMPLCSNQNFWHWPWPLTYIYIWNFKTRHSFGTIRGRVFKFRMYIFLWRGLPVHTRMFDFLTLTFTLLIIIPVLKKVNSL